MSAAFEEVSPGVHLFGDTCNVYVVTHPDASGTLRGIAIDFGSGDVLENDVHGEPVPVADQVRFRHDVAVASLPTHPIDTDQWPMPSRDEWLSYARVQSELGVPALYYVESIDNSGEKITDADLDEIAAIWAGYREGRSPA